MFDEEEFLFTRKKRRNEKKLAGERALERLLRVLDGIQYLMLLHFHTHTHTHTHIRDNNNVESLFFVTHTRTLFSLFLLVLLVLFFFIAVSNGVHREAETIGADDHSRGSSEGWTLSAEGRFAGE